MKKALILGNSSSGLYDFRNELLKKLLEDGFEVVISLPDDVKNKELEEEGCKVVHTDINRRGVNPVQDMALIKDDIVLTYTIKPNIYGGYACRSLGIPYISTVTGLGSSFERGGMLLSLIVSMYRFSLKKCDCLFFQNAENRGIFESNGIMANPFPSASDAKVGSSTCADGMASPFIGAYTFFFCPSAPSFAGFSAVSAVFCPAGISVFSTTGAACAVASSL